MSQANDDLAKEVLTFVRSQHEKAVQQHQQEGEEFSLLFKRLVAADEELEQ